MLQSLLAQLSKFDRENYGCNHSRSNLVLLSEWPIGCKQKASRGQLNCVECCWLQLHKPLRMYRFTKMFLAGTSSTFVRVCRVGIRV